MDLILSILLNLALLAVGLLLAAAGLRGRRVGDHRFCRKCGFDLTGRPAGGRRCAECGANLTRAAGVAVGRRRRRPGVAAGGVALLAAGLLGGAAMLGAVDPLPLEPAWWLARVADGRDAPAATAALGELARRQAAGSLSQGRTDALADRALALQADRSRPWDSRWGALLEAARAAGRLDDARWSRYARQAFDLRVVVRPRVRLGDPLSVDVSPGATRVGPGATFYALYQWQSLSVGGAALGSPALDTTPAAWVARLGGGWEGTPRTVVLEGEAAHTAAVGAVEVEAAVPYWIGEFTGGTIPSTRPAVVLASGTVRQARTVRIVARDDLDGVVVIDPAAAGAMARAVGARWVEWSERAGRVVVAIDVNTPALPYPLKHAVFLRAGGEEVRVGELVATPGGSSMQDRDPKLDQGKLPAAVVRTGRVDVVLRPDTEAIVRDPHGPPPWGGEIVLKDVPVNPAVR